jgi:hypothetical protein
MATTPPTTPPATPPAYTPFPAFPSSATSPALATNFLPTMHEPNAHNAKIFDAYRHGHADSLKALPGAKFSSDKVSDWKDAIDGHHSCETLSVLTGLLKSYFQQAREKSCKKLCLFTEKGLVILKLKGEGAKAYYDPDPHGPNVKKSLHPVVDDHLTATILHSLYDEHAVSNIVGAKPGNSGKEYVEHRDDEYISGDEERPEARPRSESDSTSVPAGGPGGESDQTSVPVAEPGRESDPTVVPVAEPGRESVPTAVPPAGPGGESDPTSVPPAGPGGESDPTSVSLPGPDDKSDSSSVTSEDASTLVYALGEANQEARMDDNVLYMHLTAEPLHRGDPEEPAWSGSLRHYPPAANDRSFVREKSHSSLSSSLSSSKSAPIFASEEQRELERVEKQLKIEQQLKAIFERLSIPGETEEETLRREDESLDLLHAENAARYPSACKARSDIDKLIVEQKYLRSRTRDILLSDHVNTVGKPQLTDKIGDMILNPLKTISEIQSKIKEIEAKVSNSVGPEKSPSEVAECRRFFEDLHSKTLMETLPRPSSR